MLCQYLIIIGYVNLILMVANKEYGPIAIDNRQRIKQVIRTINLLGQLVDENATGVIIEIYEDGSIRKTIR
jgi:hypothetical protein